MNKKEEIKKAWEYQSNRRWHEKEANPKAFDDPYIKGISDFKASLREEIEKKKTYHNQGFGQDADMTIAFNEVLQLIDTVKPKS